MGRLFGTDGVRGVANRDLGPELAVALGRAAARVLAGGGRPRVLVGRDTRVSGEMLESALAAGLASAGADVIRAGIVPTPAVAFLVRHMGVDAGAMISASHNPVPDNGIKFFDGSGYKLTDDVEDRIESLLNDPGWAAPVGTAVGRVQDAPEAWRDYAAFLEDTVTKPLAGIRVVVDAACGAAWQVAPEVLRRLGAEAIVLNNAPDGARINVECGSTHPGSMAEVVCEHKAHIGVAYDGDADRLIAADETGRVVDGDHIMAICGLHLLRNGQLPHKRIAATVYSNLGLIDAFRRNGGDVVVTANGDRYVLEAMRAGGLALGGEQSGHVIFLNHNTTGDGVLTSLQLLSVMAQTGRPLSELAAQMQVYPQVNRSVRVSRKNDLERSPSIQEAIAAAAERLGDTGRIFVRASGTEPVVRVMAEGPELKVIEELVGKVVEVVERELN